MSITLRGAKPAIVVDEASIIELDNWTPDLGWQGDEDTFVLVEADDEGYGEVKVVVRLEHDPDHSLSDEDPAVVGVLEWSRGDHRPSGFDGAAFIVERDRRGALWCQPPAHMVRDEEAIGSHKDWLRDIIEDGYSIMVATLYVDGGEEGSHAIGGIDSTDPACLGDLGEDLVHMLASYELQAE